MDTPDGGGEEMGTQRLDFLSNRPFPLEHLAQIRCASSMMFQKMTKADLLKTSIFIGFTKAFCYNFISYIVSHIRIGKWMAKKISVTTHSLQLVQQIAVKLHVPT